VTDQRVYNFARILVDYSANIQPGDRVLLEATTEAIPLVEALYELILQRGGHPYPSLELPEKWEIFFKYANKEQLEHMPIFRKLAYDEFESRIRIHSLANTRMLSQADLDKQALYKTTIASILQTQMKRGAAGEFKWVTTQFPTRAYAMEANMGLKDFEDFLYRACHVHEDDPVAYWKGFSKEQERYIQLFQGRDKIELHGPNVELTLSVKDRTFLNASGKNNMPDGEIFTGPVEDSANGWVRYTYPVIYEGHVVEGVELKFVDGRVEEANATSNQDFLRKTIDTDAGGRYLGEFAIGTNFEIDRFTGNILFDEKIGGSFHMALGAGYPDTGSVNKSAIHWDMICDMRRDAEIKADGELVYKNGKFVF